MINVENMSEYHYKYKWQCYIKYFDGNNHCTNRLSSTEGEINPSGVVVVVGGSWPNTRRATTLCIPPACWELFVELWAKHFLH